MKKTCIFLFSISFLLFSSSAFACSAIFIKKGANILGKNFDWYNGEGFIVKNNRGVRKTAYGLDSEHLASWTSKYGSVTFNQVGKEFPYGGVNERGLAIEMLWYEDSYYEENGKASLSELEWIQYQLDNYKTAAEVQYFLDSVSINPIYAKLHYIVADRGGRSFVVDFVEGKAVVSNTNESFQVLTNSNYLASLQYYKANKANIKHDSRTSLDRFCQLTSKANVPKTQSIKGMFQALAESAEDGKDYKTYWSIVYDLQSYSIHFKSHDNDRIKVLDLKSMDFDRSAPNYVMDINLDFIHLKPLTPEMNRNLLDKALAQSNIMLNRTMVNEHMMNPGKLVMDDTYAKHHKDFAIEFNVKKEKGYLLYTLTKGEENYKKFVGAQSAMVKADHSLIKRIHYSLPKGEYALAAFHDQNANFKMDKFLGISREPTAFSNGVKACFALPNYQKVAFDSFVKPKAVLIIK